MQQTLQFLVFVLVLKETGLVLQVADDHVAHGQLIPKVLEYLGVEVKDLRQEVLNLPDGRE